MCPVSGTGSALLADELDKSLVRDAGKVSAGCWVEVAPQILAPSPMLHVALLGLEVPVHIVEADLLPLLKRTALDEPCHIHLDKFLKGV